MVGRQTPILAIIVPLVLVFVVDGKRGVKQTWIPALVCGVAFGLAQFVSANYISVPLADIVAALVAAGAVVLLLRVWQPSEVLYAEPAEPRSGAGAPEGATVGARSDERTVSGASGGGTSGAAGTRGGPVQDSGAEVAKAYAPYVVIIAIFSITNITAVKEFLAEKPFTFAFQWPGLDVRNTAGEPLASMTYNFNWLPAAGTLMIIAGIITAVILKVSPTEAFKTYVRTYVELKSAIITVMAVLALAYVMNLSGQTTSLGAWLAGAGAAFAILSPILGWIGVAVTGLRHLCQRALRCPAGADRRRCRPRPGADGGRELLGWRARQDGQPAEPGDRGGRRRHGRAGGRHLPQGDRLEPRPAGADVHPRRPAVHTRARLDGSLGASATAAL